MALLPPHPELVLRFRRDLEALAGRAPERLGVAFSGGPDSLALLLLACAAYPGRVEVATVDHRLRPESEAEAQHAGSIAAALEAPHSILSVDVPKGGDGVQGEARRARYAALRGWCRDRGLPVLLTGHHADDQAETLIMRLRRGSGLSGLAGIRAARPEDASLTLLRPLLRWRRYELAEIARRSGLDAVNDPSNQDMRFDRVEVRRFLEGSSLFDANRLARTAAALSDAEEAVAWSLSRLEEDRCGRSGGEWTIDTAELPRELRRRLLARTISALRRHHGLEPAWTGGEDVEGLLSTLEEGGTATRAGIVASGLGSLWRLRLAPPRRSSEG